MNIKRFFSYFNPFSEFQAKKNFENLKRWQQGLTVTLTALTALATIPLLGLGGLAVFRAMVGRFTKIDPNVPSNAPHEQTAATADDVARSALDDQNSQLDKEEKLLQQKIVPKLRSTPEPESKVEDGLRRALVSNPCPQSLSKPKSHPALNVDNSQREKVVQDVVKDLTVRVEKQVELTREYNRLKEDLNIDIMFLRAFANLKLSASENNTDKDWTEVIGKLHVGIPALDRLTSEDVQVNAILDEIKAIERRCYYFIEVIDLLNTNKSSGEELLKSIHGLLNRAKNGLTQIQDHYDNSNNTVYAGILDQAQQIVDDLIVLLPRNEASKSYWDRFKGVFVQSDNPFEIKWKVHKYEAQITQLRKKLDTLIRNNDPKKLAVARDLCAILCSVKINPKNQKRYNQTYLAQVRAVINKKFIPHFRKEYQKKPNDKGLKIVAKILFTKVILEDELFFILKTFNEKGAAQLGQDVKNSDPNARGEHPFVRQIHTVYERLKAVSYSAKAPLLNQWANSARGQFNRNFDPSSQGNPTHLFWRLKVGKRTVKMLGMGTPTHENITGKAALNEEFLALMKRYKREGKKHLTVNNQNARPKTGVLASIINGDETARCNLILDKQDDEDVKGTYFAIALTKNSDFYWQKKEWAEKDEANTFKKDLYAQIFKGSREDTGCYIPQTIRDLINDFDQKAKDMINHIHEQVFKGKDSLTIKERQWFIELFYDHLVKLILAEGEIDSANISCKDQIDRAAASNAQLCANCYIVAQKDGALTKEQQDQVMMLMMVRALVVRKRHPIHERVERFAEGLDMSFKHVAELKRLHHVLFSETQCVPKRAKRSKTQIATETSFRTD